MPADPTIPTTPVRVIEPTPSTASQSAPPVEPTCHDDDLHGALAGVVEYASWLRHLG